MLRLVLTTTPEEEPMPHPTEPTDDSVGPGLGRGA
jgi:hypothetical protein